MKPFNEKMLRIYKVARKLKPFQIKERFLPRMKKKKKKKKNSRYKLSEFSANIEKWNLELKIHRDCIKKGNG